MTTPLVGVVMGSALMRRALERCAQEGAGLLWLNARATAIGFYERLGLEVVGDEFRTERTGLPHRRMEARIGRRRA